MSIATFDRLSALLNEQQARYRVVEHPTAGKSEEVAKIRGTQLGQGAKALLCHVKGNGIKQHVLSLRLVSILTYCSLPTRCCLNALTNWPLTQAPLNAQWS